MRCNWRNRGIFRELSLGLFFFFLREGEALERSIGDWRNRIGFFGR